jgi:hypothetical protein
MKPIRKDLRNIFTDNYLRVSKADAEANGKQALIEAYKKGKFTDAEAEQLATNQHAINMRRLEGVNGRQSAYGKHLDTVLKDKIKNKVQRQSVVDRLLEVVRHSERDENGNLTGEITQEQFNKVVDKYLSVSKDGLPYAVEKRLRELDTEIKNESDFDLKMKLNAEASQLIGDLIKPTVGEKASTILQIGMLGGVKSFERDFFGGLINSSISGINPFSGILKPKSYSFLKKTIADAWDGKNTLNPEGTTDNRSTFKLESGIGKFFERLLKVRLTVADAIWLEHVYTAKKELYAK